MSTVSAVIHSIKEAFSRSAIFLKLRVFLDSESGGGVQDPRPSNGDIPDKLLSLDEIFPSLQPFCSDEGKVEESEGAKDEVVISAGGEKLDVDRVLVLGGEDEGEGMELGFGGKRGHTVHGELLPEKKNDYASDDDLNEDDEKKEGQILIKVLI